MTKVPGIEDADTLIWPTVNTGDVTNESKMDERHPRLTREKPRRVTRPSTA